MTPFYTRFPDLAATETRVVHVVAPGGHLPVGEYGFVEYYCEDPGCDCRRALLEVTTPRAPDTTLATINFGWESAEFYTAWMHGDAEAGREITAAMLDPLNPQSRYAEHLLDIFQKVVITDPAYVARLARHYEMFKATQRPPSTAIPAVLSSPTETPTGTPMGPAEILRQLQRVPDRADFAPYETALCAATQHRDALIPELIAAIDRVSADPAHYLEDQEDCRHMFAIYLLAQFREPRALDSFIRFFSLPGDQSLNLTGDMVTEHGAAVLASVCGGDPAPLLKLIHDETVNEFVRHEAIDALVVQNLWGERLGDAVIADLRGLFRTLPRPGNAYLWAGLVSVVCDLHAGELAPESRQAFAEELVDESVLDLDWFETELRELKGESLEYFRERNTPIDAAAECSSWICFRDEEAEAADWEVVDDLDEAEDVEPWDLPLWEPEGPAVPTPHLAPPKVGRNDPCPCGSGKKYKKCCGK